MTAPPPFYRDELVTLYCGDARAILPELEAVHCERAAQRLREAAAA